MKSEARKVFVVVYKHLHSFKEHVGSVKFNHPHHNLDLPMQLKICSPKILTKCSVGQLKSLFHGKFVKVLSRIFEHKW